MSDPTTHNRTAEVLNGVISALMAGGEKAAEIYLTSLAPEFLGIPVVQWILDEGVHYIAQIVSIAGQKFADGVVINIQTKGEESKVLTTATALAIAIASQDQEAIDGATKAASDAYKEAFNLDGWATPT